MRMKPNHAGRQADPMQAEPGTLTEGVPRARIEHRNTNRTPSPRSRRSHEGRSIISRKESGSPSSLDDCIQVAHVSRSLT